MLNYQVHVNLGPSQAAQMYEVLEGMGAKGQALRLKAQVGAKYRLAQVDSLATKGESETLAPDEVRVKRMGKHLHMFLDGNPDVDIILEDYYAVMPDGYNGLIGQAENGAFHEYIPVVPEASNLIPELLDGAEAVNMALGSSEVSGAGAAVSLLVLNPLLGALGVAEAGAIAIATATLAVNAGTTDTSISVTGALSADSDSGIRGDNLTRNAQPKVSGRTIAGAQVFVKLLNAQGDVVGTYTTIADADGNYVVNVSSNLSDGTYTPEMTVTTAAGATSAPIRGTAFTVDAVTEVSITDPGVAGTLAPISGKAEAGGVVTLKDALGQVIGSTTADSSGQWRINPSSPVVSGDVSATAVDTAGNSASAVQTMANAKQVATVDITGVTTDNGVSGTDLATATAKTLTGTTAADTLYGSDAADTLSAGGGGGGTGSADKVYAGAGNDTVSLDADNITQLATSGSGALVDGGAGTNILKLSGSGITLDLSLATVSSSLRNFSTVDLTGSGNNTLKLNLEDVLSMSGAADNATSTGADESKMLVVNGDAGDVVQLVTGSQWTQAGSGLAGATLGGTVAANDYGSSFGFVTGDTYAKYTYGGATLFVDETVTMSTL